jgi:hypothetical protein
VIGGMDGRRRILFNEGMCGGEYGRGGYVWKRLWLVENVVGGGHG